MEYYRNRMSSTVTPKMHMLEVPWLRWDSD